MGRPRGSGTGVRQFDPATDCGKKNRSGRPCKQKKGARTQQPGAGPCWLHGGAAADANTKHGRYSKRLEQSLGPVIDAKLEENNATGEHGNLRRNIALLEALLDRFVARFDSDSQLLQLWADATSAEFQTILTESDASKVAKAIDSLRAKREKPPEVTLDLAPIVALVETAGRNAERLHRMERADSVPRRTFEFVVRRMNEAITECADEKTVQAIARRFDKIRW